MVGVSDGDTINVLDRAKGQHKICLSGIDAPKKGQAFGNASKDAKPVAPSEWRMRPSR